MSKTVGNLFVRLALQSNDYVKGLAAANKAANKTMRDINREFKSVERAAEPFKKAAIAAAASATAIAYAAARMMSSVVKTGDSFADMSRQTGIAVEELSALSYASQIAGADIDMVQRGLRILVGNMQDMKHGTGEARKTFKELGIEVTTTDGALRKSTDVMFEVADRLASIKNETQQIAYAQEIFGSRYGQYLLPLFRDGSRALRDQYDQAKRVGAVWSTEDALAADAFSDSLVALKASVGGLQKQFGILAAQELKQYVDRGTEAVIMARQWAEAHRDIIRQKIDTTLTGIGDALEWIREHKDTLKTALEFAVAGYATTKIANLATALWGLAGALKVVAATPISLGVLVGGHAALGGYMVAKRKEEERPLVSQFFSGQKYRTPKEQSVKPFAAPSTADLLGFYGYGRTPAVAMTPPPAGGGGAGAGGTLYGKFADKEFEYWATREKKWIADIEANRKADIESAKEHAGKIIDFRREIQEKQIELTRTGFDRDRMLERLRFNEEATSYGTQYDLIELAREKHQMNMELIAQAESQQMIDRAAQFGMFWGDMLVGVVQQAGNSFDNVVRLFDQMIKKMLIKATVSGILGFIFSGGNPAAGMAAARGSFGIPGMAGGGMVYKPTLAVIGERGPERVLNSRETRAYNSGGGGYIDNSNLTIVIGEGTRGMNVEEIARVVDRVIRERKSKEFEKFKREIA